MPAELTCAPTVALVIGFFLGMAFMVLFTIQKTMSARDMRYALTHIDWLCAREIEKFKAPILHKIGRIAGEGLGRLPKKAVK